MPTDHTLHPAVLTTRLASLAALLAVVVGAMVLVGWAFDIAALKSVLPGWVAMKANTAVCFILIGIALLLITRPPATFNPQFSTFISRFARLCGLLVGLIGLLTLAEYIFGWNPGIDQWLFREPHGAVGTSDPGRMAPETALCFVLLAAALWITGGSRHIRKSTRTRWSVLAPALIGLLVVTLALAAGLSYPTPGLGAYGWFGLTIMAMHTAVLFVILGMAVMAISWRQDVLQWSLGRNTTVAFACGMAVLVLVGFNINRSQFWMGEIDRKIAFSVKAQDYIESIVIEVIDAQAHTRGYIITGDEQFKARYLEAKGNSNVNLDALRKLITSNPRQQQQFARIETQAKTQLQWFQQVIDARQTSMADATRNNMIRHGEGLLDNFRITYSQVKNEHQQFIKELRQEAESVSRFSYITIAAGTLASLLIFLTVMFRLNFAVNKRKQVENALRESEAGIRALVEHSPIAMIVDVGVDADEKIIMMNRKFTELFGFTIEDVPDVLHWWPLAYPDEKYREEVKAEWTGKIGKAIQSHANIEPLETTVACKDGTSRYVRFSLSSIGGRNIITFEDLTERKRNEDTLNAMTGKLRDSQQLLDSIVEHIPVMVFVKRASDLRFELFNRAGEKLLGYSRNDLLGKGNYDLWPKDQGDWFTAADRKVLASHEATEIQEEPIKTASGETRYLHTWKVALRDASGEPAHLLGISIDITERKRMEESLRKLSLAVEQSPTSIIITDLDANIEYVNAAFVKTTGYSLPEVVGKNPRLLHSGKTPRATYDDLWAHLTRGETWKGEFINRRKDGSEYVEAVLFSPVRQPDGRVTHYLAIEEEITLFKQAQEALRVSRDDLSRLLNSMAEGAYGVDTNGNCTFVNRAFLQMLGYQNESEVLGKHVHELIHHTHADGSPYPAEECRAYCAYLTNQSINVSDEVFWRKDGTAIPVEYWSHPIETDGTAIGAIVTFVDITERKRAEGKLRESEEKFSRIFESSPAMVAIGTLDGKMVDVNLSYADFLGFPRQEMLGKSLSDLGVVSAEELQRLLKLAHRAGESLRDVEVTLLVRGGKRLNALLSAEIVTLGGVRYRLATLQDITARKQAETALREKEILLSESQRIAHIGSWRFESGMVWWSDETYRIYGVSPDTFTLNAESFLNSMVPEDRPLMQEWIAACMADKKPDALEFRINKPDGAVRYIRGFGDFQPGNKNNPPYLTGMVYDITERKLADARLAEQLEELRRWHDVTSGREGRILGLKHEINELLVQAGQPPRYPSTES